MSQKTLEDLQRQYPTNLNERRGKKPSRASFSETRRTHALAAHESLDVMADAIEVSVDIQPESGQKLVSEFFHLVASGELDRCLAGFAPAAQTHMIEKVQAVQSLLEKFLSKHQPIQVSPIH